MQHLLPYECGRQGPLRKANRPMEGHALESGTGAPGGTCPKNLDRWESIYARFSR